MKPKRYGFLDVGQLDPIPYDDPVSGDPAVEAAVEGIAAEIESPEMEERADAIEAAHLNIWRDPPAWEREPSAEFPVAVDGATVIGAACLVGLVVFFIGAVIWGWL